MNRAAIIAFQWRTREDSNFKPCDPFEKIRKHLPGFACEWDARRGAEQLYDVFGRIDMTKEVFEYRTFTRLKQLEYLIRTQQIDPQFFWTNEGEVRSAS